MARYTQRALSARQRAEHTNDVALYRSLVKPGDLCFDVGANLGEKSEAMLAAGASVVAFEPNPRILPELKARCGRNPNWRVIEAGVGSAAGLAQLYARKSHGQSGFSQSWDDAGGILGTYHVPVITLDHAIQHFGVPEFLKVDVEGWEPQVFDGLSQRIPLVAFEYHRAEMTKAVDCLSRLRFLGQAYDQVNFTRAETAAFVLPEWVEIAEVIRNPAAYLTYGYGDIYVRATS